MRRSSLLTTAAATAGVAIAFSVGLAANAIAGRSISNGPLPAASELAPPATTAIATTTATTVPAGTTVSDADRRPPPRRPSPTRPLR